MGRKAVALMDRVFAKCATSVTGCVEWTGTVSHGYGQVTRRDGSMVVVHRVVYEEFVGTIPDGMQLDHLCRNRRCCRLDHLEVVTPQVNVRRAMGWTFDDGWVCKRGHRVIESRVRDGVRCKQCLDMHRSNYMAARKGRR